MPPKPPTWIKSSVSPTVAYFRDGLYLITVLLNVPAKRWWYTIDKQGVDEELARGEDLPTMKAAKLAGREELAQLKEKEASDA